MITNEKRKVLVDMASGRFPRLAKAGGLCSNRLVMRYVFTLVPMLFLAGCAGFPWGQSPDLEARAGAIQAYHPGARVFLYSLEPTFDKADGKAFHGYPVRGRVEITGDKEKAALLSSLAEGVRKAPNMLAMCFEPHHGLRVIDGEKEVDFVICFSCLQVRAYNFAQGETFSMDDYPEKTYDAALRRHGLPTAETAGEDRGKLPESKRVIRPQN